MSDILKKIESGREFRKAAEFTPSEEEYIVEGYASTFEPYELFREGDQVIYERIDAKAFDDADMSDIKLQFDHEGRVFARQKNDTLKVTVDEKGLKIRADLSKTEGARELYEDIKSGMIDEMSFAFSVAEDDFDRETRTRNVLAIRKVYDVSAVSFPANPDTAISARNYFNGVIEAEEAERLLAEERKAQIRRIKLKGSINND